MSRNKMLMVAGVLIAAGLGIWLYGSLTTTETLTQDTRVLGRFFPLLKVHAYLDPEINPVGVILVEKESFAANDVSMRVIGPHGDVLLSDTVEGATVDEYFDVYIPGTYTLVVRNDVGEMPVSGAIGYASESWRLSLGPAGIVMLSIGTAWATLVLAIILKDALR